MKFTFTNFPNLTTERLELRQVLKNDYEAILFLRSDPAINQYIERAKPENLDDVDAFVKKITRGYQNKELIYWAITSKESTKMIASICLWKFSADKTTAEVGYDLIPQFQNQGIMSEALKTVLNFGFQKLGLNNIEAFTHSMNQNSKKLLLKNGFTLAKGKKDEGNHNNIVFSIKKRNSDKRSI